MSHAVIVKGMDPKPSPNDPASRQPSTLPPGLDLLWGLRESGRRGPKPLLSIDAIVAAAVRLADAEGLEAVSMARVAKELGFTTMSLYRYVTNKDELLQLMWNASAQGAEDLVLAGSTLAGTIEGMGAGAAGHARPTPLDYPDAYGCTAGRAELAYLRRTRHGSSR